ncbi:MAG: amidohydrolase family protein [Vicinamibacterales bacterium]
MIPRRARPIVGFVSALAFVAACGSPAPPPSASPPEGTAPADQATQPAPPELPQVSLVIANATVVTVDADNRVIAPGSIAIEGNRIVAVDTADAIAARYASHEIIDMKGQIVLPGLINLHTHAPMVLYRGLADDLALMDWLEKYIFPAEAKTVSPDFVRVGTRLAALEMIRSGTTMFVDMYYFEEEVAAAVKEAGIRGVLGQTIIQFPVPDAPTPAAGLERTEAFIKAFANDDLVVPSVAPHSTRSTPTRSGPRARLRSGTASPADPPRRDAGRGAHRAGALRAPAGRVPRLDQVLGAGHRGGSRRLGEPAGDPPAHGARGGRFHNPESNMKLASGTAPVPAYLEAGTRLGLGTDGAASNNDLDMFEAMREAALLHKLIARDPTVVSAREAMAMATIGGARALGMDDRLGSIEPGSSRTSSPSAPIGPARSRSTTRSRTWCTSRTATTCR